MREHEEREREQNEKEAGISQGVVVYMIHINTSQILFNLSTKWKYVFKPVPHKDCTVLAGRF